MRNDIQRCRASNTSEPCDLSGKSKKCIACRYKRCLEIGMDPALVQGSRKRLVKTEQFDDDEDDEEQESMRAATPVSSVSQLTSSSSFSSSLYELKPPSRHDPQNMNFFTIPPSPSFTIPPSPSFTSSSSSSSCVEPCVPGPSSSVPQYQRPSVIMRAGRDETSKLQLQADILKFHGDVLKHTGQTPVIHIQ